MHRKRRIMDFEKDLGRCFKYLLQSQQDLERTKLQPPDDQTRF